MGEMSKLPLSSSTSCCWSIWSFTGQSARSRRHPSPIKQASRGLVVGSDLGSVHYQQGRPSGLWPERAQRLGESASSPLVGFG